jgi:acylphosphatase
MRSEGRKAASAHGQSRSLLQFANKLHVRLFQQTGKELHPRLCYTFWGFVSDAKQAKRYFVSGRVQGVGFRYFTQHAAEKLNVSGYVRNRVDGRVEVFAVGTPQQHAELRALLERGPRFSSVEEVREEIAAIELQLTSGFEIDESA